MPPLRAPSVSAVTAETRKLSVIAPPAPPMSTDLLRRCLRSLGNRLGRHLLLARRNHHDHLPAFELGKLLDQDQIAQLVSNAVSKAIPISWCVISRPRKRSVILHLSPSARKRRMLRILML